MIDLPGQEGLALFGALTLADIHRHTADADDAAVPVDRRRRSADAPTHFAVRSVDAEFRLVRARALAEFGDRLAQLVQVIGMQQGLDVRRCHLKAVRIDAEDRVLALVPQTVAGEPVPVSAAELGGCAS